jgi:hypothetical protein
MIANKRVKKILDVDYRPYDSTIKLGLYINNFGGIKLKTKDIWGYAK